MESCNYHPLTPSQFYCEQCQMGFCTHCVDHSVGGEAKCFHCSNHLATRVTADNVEPFWRRLEKAFKYPLNKDAMMMIVGLSVISVVLTQVPLPAIVGFILSLVVAGASINYAFMCLTATSEGELTPPSLADAFVDSLNVLWKLFLMVLLAGLVVWALGVYIAPLFAFLAALLLFVGMPAILMCFATSQSVLDSLNPVNFVRVMTSVGGPYLVLVMFLLIMVSSVGVLNSFIGEDFLALSAIMQSSVANYYAIVSFHLMGYMLYQYQDRLGFATADDDTLLERAEPYEVVLAHVNICLKEGEYDSAIRLLKEGVAASPKQQILYNRLFDLLYRLENKVELNNFADQYLAFAITHARGDALLADYRKIKQLAVNFLPKDAYVRLFLANAAHAQGDAITTVQLINGMHKQHPEFTKLIEAYQLMASALAEIPSMAAKAQQCRKLISVLQFQQSKAEFAPEQDSVYEIKEPQRLKKVVENTPEANGTENSQGDLYKSDYAPVDFKL